MNEVGYVLSIKNSLIYIDGMPSAKLSDLVINDQGVKGMVTALYPDRVEVWVLDDGLVFPGQLFKKLDQTTQFLGGPALLGRAVNPIGVPIDGKGEISKTRIKSLPLDSPSPKISEREIINNQLVSGISLVDTLIPIGKGQRQLVLGDAHSGKSSFLIDLIVSQVSQGITCIYASIGKPINELRNLIDILTEVKAMPKTAIIAASATDSAPLIYLTPYSAMALARFFQSQGQDVLLVLDDLGVHAKVYRELSLLSNRPPGRESYPGDIFYIHSHLMEQAGKFSKSAGGGSITALPVIELNLNDFTSFIPTNLMSMTDGHLLFKSSLRALGRNPAIDISLSVSRVGRQTQNRLQNQLAAELRQILAEGAELDTLSKFSGELPINSQLTLIKKSLIEESLKQEQLYFLSLEAQTIFLGLILTSFFGGRDQKYLAKIKNNLIKLILTDPKIKELGKNIFKITTLADLVVELEKIVPILQEKFK